MTKTHCDMCDVQIWGSGYRPQRVVRNVKLTWQAAPVGTVEIVCVLQRNASPLELCQACAEQILRQAFGEGVSDGVKRIGAYDPSLFQQSREGQG